MTMDSNAASDASAATIMDEARRMQGAHGAHLIAAALRKMRQTVSQATSPDGLDSVPRLRLR